MKRLPVLRLLAVDDTLAEASARLAADLGLRGADAVYVALAARLSARLVTWDREQSRRSAARIYAGPPEL
jgi:predicted nucleic acid-binding protein